MMLELSRLNNKIKTFISIPWVSKILLLEALMYSAVARSVIVFIPFKKYKKYIGIPNQETPLEIESQKYHIINAVSWAVHIITSRTPWQSKCLVQALTAQQMLKKRKLSTTLYLGVNKENGKDLNAHAWLRCGQLFVTGGRNRNEFAEVAKFAKYR
jgi:hypothetical protein